MCREGRCGLTARSRQHESKLAALAEAEREYGASCRQNQGVVPPRRYSAHCCVVNVVAAHASEAEWLLLCRRWEVDEPQLEHDVTGRRSGVTQAKAIRLAPAVQAHCRAVAAVAIAPG